jgi:amino acid transporter
VLLTFLMTIDGLANSGNAPKIFLKASANGLPYVSVAFNAMFALLAYMGIKTGSGKVFGWFANLTAVAGLMTWFGISLTYLRFYKGMKAQGIDRTRLPFYSNLQPFAAWYSMVACLLISFVRPLSAWLSSEVLILINSSLADGPFSSKDTGQLTLL